MSYYIINESGEIVKEPDLVKWANWFEKANRIIARDEIGQFLVSTIFLGMDHSFGTFGIGIPILFETMVFDIRKDTPFEQFTRRYHNRDEALIGHQDVLKEVQFPC